MPAPSSLDQQRTLTEALRYAERFQWAVFPVHSITATGDCTCAPDHPQRKNGVCGHPGKHPRTSAGWKNSTLDPVQIKRWFGPGSPPSNIGIATGPSRLVVVDEDPRNRGDEHRAELEAKHGTLPETVRALTGGGGLHYLYARPEGIASLPGYPLAQGVEIKADGGYIVATPSLHLSGKRYAWDLSAEPGDVPVASLPRWILEFLLTQAAARANAKPPSGLPVNEGFLGAAFEAAGWLGRGLGPQHAAARCPWEDEHTGGSRFDGSTVIFAPAQGHRLGWFHCSHDHCRGRTPRDVLGALPEAAKAQAREQLGIAKEYEETEQPSSNGSAPPIDWQSGLRLNAEGRITKDQGNAALLLTNLPEWRECLLYDAFADRILWRRPPPELPGMIPPAPGDELAEHHLGYVHHWLAKRRSVSFTNEAVVSAVAQAARRNTVHPLRDYLSAITWDGKARLATWLSAYLGARPSPYTSAIGVWWLVSAVARVFKPGCQADHLLILEGPQGRGKSQAVRELSRPWYLGGLPDLRSKDAALLLSGHWVVEIGELDAFKGSSGTRIKDFVSQPVDAYRPPYGRLTIHRPRSCVFIGTTNEAHYLYDSTGNRRFWPVRVHRPDVPALTAARDQLWAEARLAYEEGVSWWPTPALASAIQAEQEERFNMDEWEGPIAALLETWHREGVTVAELLNHLKLEQKDWGRPQQMRVAAILGRLGWERPNMNRRREGSRLWFPKADA